MATVLVVVFGLCVANLVFSVKVWRRVTGRTGKVEIRLPRGKARKEEAEVVEAVENKGEVLAKEELEEIVKLARKMTKGGADA